jgi:phenylacetate-CoA ligase
MFAAVFLRKYLEHRLNARISRSALETRQMRKFRALVSLVEKHSPYYARLIKEHGISPSNCLPSDFPVLTKGTLMRHFDEIVTSPEITNEGIGRFLSGSRNPRELYREHIVLHTSGSSGEIGYFVYSQEDWARGMAQFSGAHPYSVKKRRAAYVGAVQGHFAGVTQFMTMERSFLRLLYRVRCYDINDPLRRIVDGLNEFHPHIITGYPSALVLLARKQLAGDLRIDPEWCEFGGEPLAPCDQQVIEQAFHVPVVNFYASTEHLLMAVGRPGAEGMQLCEDDLLFELKEDHTCVTNLFNRTLPMIRYRMEDVLKPLSNSDNELPYRIIADIVGRRESSALFVNRRGEEDEISPFVFIEFHTRGLRRFQVCITGPDSFHFRCVLEPGMTSPERQGTIRMIQERLRAILRQKEMDNVVFEVEETLELPVDQRTGKFRLIERRYRRGGTHTVSRGEC